MISSLLLLEELYGDFEDLETGETNQEEDQKMDFDGKIKYFH